jgi:L-methionine (R)-S-oxide reductase
MAEQTLDLKHLPKTEAYEALTKQAHAVLLGLSDEIAAMATLSCMMFHAFAPLWAGFYRVVSPGALLRIGPYQGTLGCLEIPFGKGVCGAVAADRRTRFVRDVHNFEGHISCDARARSEIVVPVMNMAGDLIAVFDVDSERIGAFDETDAQGLESLMRWFSVNV